MITRRAFTGGMGLAAAAITAAPMAKAQAEAVATAPSEPSIAARADGTSVLTYGNLGPYSDYYPNPSPEIFYFGDDPAMMRSLAQRFAELENCLRHAKRHVIEAIADNSPDHANACLTIARNSTQHLNSIISMLQGELNQAIIDQRVLVDVIANIRAKEAAGKNLAEPLNAGT